MQLNRPLKTGKYNREIMFWAGIFPIFGEWQIPEAASYILPSRELCLYIIMKGCHENIPLIIGDIVGY